MNEHTPEPADTTQAAQQPLAGSRGDQVMLTVVQAMQHANAAYAGGDWDRAEQLCQRILQAHADHFGALQLLGIIAAQTQRPADAAELLRRAVAAQPLNPAAHNNYGNVLKCLGRFEEARASYERALDLAPDCADAYNNRGIVLQELRRFDDAVDSFDQALKVRPDHAEAWCNRGVALQELGRFDQAVASYDRALKVRPDYADAYANRGSVLQKLGRHDDALASYERALTIEPRLQDPARDVR